MMDDRSFASSHDEENGSNLLSVASAETTDSPGTGTSSKTNSEHDTAVALSEKETENVKTLRCLVFGILFGVAIVVVALMYSISKEAENEEIATQFEAAVGRIEEAFEAIRTERIATLASLAIAAIAHGVDHSRDWPFVSLSSYQQRAFTAKLNSGALQVSIAPFVSQENKLEWEKYICSDGAEVDWIEQSVEYQDVVKVDQFIDDYGTNFREGYEFRNDLNHTIKYQDKTTGEIIPMEGDAPNGYLPFWEMSPFLSYDEVNIDMYQNDNSQGEFGNLSLKSGAIVTGDMIYQPKGDMDSDNPLTAKYAQLLSIIAGEEVEYQGDPMTYFFIPIFDSFVSGVREPKAVLVGLFHWGSLFRDVLPESVGGIDIVLENPCEEDPFTFRVDGVNVTPRHEKGDLHEKKYTEWGKDTSVLETGITNDGTSDGLSFVDRDVGCKYSMTIYPSDAFVKQYRSSNSIILVVSVSVVFLFAIAMFVIYDRLVEERQNLVLSKALQSTAIVSSMFPKNVRERLIRATDNQTAMAQSSRANSALRDMTRPKHLKGSSERDIDFQNPIADLFPDCTVLFADICGFTAWSSAREPRDVFILLQSVYKAFDKIAARRRVFKVETIGDSYVAVTGLPEAQAQHAIIMCKFARDCLVKMHDVTSALELQLGPDTTELSMRFGLNSGQVTGGVLQGDRARFQLFGDTVNTAARMESTGMKGRIQMSQSTADLLAMAGKEHWIVARQDPVMAKGKGLMKTFWLHNSQYQGLDQTNRSDAGISEEDYDRSEPLGCSVRSTMTTASSDGEEFQSTVSEKHARLIGWVSDLLLEYVKQIISKNVAAGVLGGKNKVSLDLPQGNQSARDEFSESFVFAPPRTFGAAASQLDHVRLLRYPTAAKQMRLFVTEISALYDGNNPFHNFEHACHVTMSVHKLIKLALNVNHTLDSEGVPTGEPVSHVIGSDPLILFSVVFAGLIHDVGHRGVPNGQLAKEDPQLAESYDFKSIAEQNSIDVAWKLLGDERFGVLHELLFPTQADVKKVRQVVVQTVIATDIFDKDLASVRQERWEKVFGRNGEEAMYQEQSTTKNPTQVAKAIKIAVVLEHILQASDVSHTMQHWHVYLKWNRRLFREMLLAHRNGRMAKNPITFWYEGELSFFDNYIIPLAKKLKTCQIVGSTSHEYLHYAESNRAEWERKGKSIVEAMELEE